MNGGAQNITATGSDLDLFKGEANEALAEFRALRAANRLRLDLTEKLASRAPELFLAYYHAGGGYLCETIALLCEIATLEDKTLAQPGLQGLFTFLVERLSDSFNPHYCALYDKLFAQVVSFCRCLPRAAALDAELRRFKLVTEEDLLARKEKLKLPRRFPDEARAAVRKVLVLSRVTLGADIAVTSVIMAQMKDLFPNAEIVLLALPSTAQLFAGDTRVRVHAIQYDREGELIERLTAWLDIVRAVDEEVGDLQPEEYLVMDPDSRLTQLGIFPVIQDEERYYFFESRGYRKEGLECISQLTAAWLAECFGDLQPVYPYLCLREQDTAFGKRVCQGLRRAGAKHIVTINFGVGGNDRKRVGDSFEAELTRRLIGEGSTIILAKGVGPIELARANRLMCDIRAGGKRTSELAASSIEELASAERFVGVDLVLWQGEIGAFCGLVGASDLYIGYDSAGQHIAAALGVPTIDIFVDPSHPMIAKRWHPYGPGIVKAVHALPGAAISRDQQEELLEHILACYTAIRAKTLPAARSPAGAPAINDQVSPRHKR